MDNDTAKDEYIEPVHFALRVKSRGKRVRFGLPVSEKIMVMSALMCFMMKRVDFIPMNKEVLSNQD